MCRVSQWCLRTLSLSCLEDGVTLDLCDEVCVGEQTIIVRKDVHDLILLQRKLHSEEGGRGEGKREGREGGREGERERMDASR